jgi:hypothetical protein
MDALREVPGISMPSDDLPWCVDEEIVHPRRKDRTYSEYSNLLGRHVASSAELVDAFFQRHAGATYAGFKTMPLRHDPFDALSTRQDIQFIVLTRRDFASTVASLHLAKWKSTWKREGGPQSIHWQYTPTQNGRLKPTIDYLNRSIAMLKTLVNPISIYYEDLVESDFCNADLNRFFGHTIKLTTAKGATTAKQYVLGWAEFKDFVNLQTT